ncbi:YbaK/EbsC family protein [Opitutus sp. ER46]|uniref:aminoacyl-tRNA deacylase n=1 Tax=Opitutus sp. ER46 TaxID=2161864 RepID=UPI000D30E99F|nr:YbaK/EbsC family protein [Opitutus sp. ER46]PTY00511.1 deacylase [Opitutus sp. ER46]
MPAKKLKDFLESRGAKYVSIQHSPAFTASEIAASAHVTGRDFAKTVVVKMGDDLAMVVLPANRKIMLSELRDMIDEDIDLATEDEFQERFPDCELGAMPPFGNLYGLPVYVERSLADEQEIAFSAGTHHEIILMAFDDYADLVQPTVMEFATA